MKPRFVKGAENRLRIIRTAADLFHKQGAHATSPDEIIEASRTGKGQFYHYFKSKEGLIHEVLQAHLEAIRNATAPVEYRISSWKGLERWFLAHVELQKSFGMTRGCPFGTIGNEVTESDELVRQDLSLIFEVMKNKLAAFFLQEKSRGRLRCIASIQGGMLVGKIKRSSETVERTVQEALAHVKSYLVKS